jgi:hypothetical protein
MAMMTKHEVPNNTPEQVLAYVNAALAIVAEVEPDDDLRAAVFAAAYAGVSGKQIIMEQQQAGLSLDGLGLGARH